MKAFVLSRYGGPDAAAITEVPTPSPAAGQVRIRVKAAGLNPLDFKIREGKVKIITRFPLPIVMGSEVSGVVDALGDGVKGFAIGDEVYARVDKKTLGAFAEYTCIEEGLIAKKPASLDFTSAAAVPLAALTALQVLRDELQVGPGFRVFISGGAGGVGTFAIQLAKHLGAEVTTTASPRGHELVTRLGADRVVDYTAPFPVDLPEHDGAFDLVAGEALTQAFSIVKKGGRVVTISGIPEPRTATIDLKRGAGLATLFWFASLPTRLRAGSHDYRYFFMHPSGADLTYLAGLVDDGKLEVILDRAVPFADIAKAFEHLESGRAKGKIVVTF